jgi:uncharacterized protein involved in type VI secretion and phage assembly
VDPDELGRIQVKFPTLHEEPLSFWLRQISPNAGAERGIYCLPEKDDEVVVVFMQGSQDVGVILGQVWNGVDKPPTEAKDGMPTSSDADASQSVATDTHADGSTSLDDNDRRFWRSRSGHLMVFDDTSGSETVQIWDQSHAMSLVFDSAGGNIMLSNTSGNINIRAQTDVLIDAGGNIKMYAAQNMETESGMDMTWKAGQNWQMEAGMDVEQKAGMNYKVEGGINTELKAGVGLKGEGVTLEMKGSATAKVEGGAMCEVKGGVVMLN